MKKFLILMLVFGITSVANATLTLVADVEGTPYPLDGSGELLDVGTTVHVKVVQDAPYPDGSGGEMEISMLASGGSAVDTTPQMDASYAGWAWLFNGGAEYLDNSDGTWYAWFGKTGDPTDAWTPGTPGLGSWVGVQGYGGWDYVSTIEYSFQVTETTDMTWGGVGVWDGTDMGGLNGGTVNVIPEPMTIALLGLGGLFLRRRK